MISFRRPLNVILKIGGILLVIKLTWTCLSYLFPPIPLDDSVNIITREPLDNWYPPSRFDNPKHHQSHGIPHHEHSAQVYGGGKEDRVLTSTVASRWCTDEDWLNGKWVAKKGRPTDLAGLKAAIGLDPDEKLICLPIDDDRDNEAFSQDEPAHIQRLIDVANWDWIPQRQGGGDCEAIKFSPRDFIKRSLRSRAGYHLVGDSLQEQIYAHLKRMIAYSGGAVQMHSNMEINVHIITLNLDHPDAPRILADAGVSAERGKIPILTYHRDNTVLSRSEIDHCFLGKDKAPNYQSLFDHPEFEIGINVNTTWYLDWVSLLKNAPSPILDEARERGVVEEENVVILSYGAHWNWGIMGDIAPDELLPGYERSINIALEKIEAVKKYDIRAFYRATSPPHIGCNTETKADNGRETHRSRTDPEDTVFNWEYFPKMNDAWIRKLAKSNTVEYFDIWPMSITRPDAHKHPPMDCLHWCEPGPPVVWIEYLWNKLATTSRNTDYDNVPRST